MLVLFERSAREHRHARHRGRSHALPKAVTGFARGWCRCSRATVYVLVRRRPARAARASAATDGPAPRRYDGRTTAARVRAAVFVRSEKSNALVGDGVPGFRQARRTSTAPLVACTSLRLKPGECSSSAAHTLCTVGTAYCAAATAVTAMGSPSLALSHLCCGLCERHCSATAGTL